MVPAFSRSAVFLVSALGLASLLPVPAAAAQTFECKDVSGRVTFSTVPCDVSANPAPPDGPARDYESIYGHWRGQAQFKQTESGGAAGLARMMTPLTLAIDEGGTVTGGSQDFGCQVAGVVRQGPMATDPVLDLTLSSCSNKAFNRRYTGSLILNAKQRYAALQLTSVAPARFARPVTCEIAATLRR